MDHFSLTLSPHKRVYHSPNMDCGRNSVSDQPRSGSEIGAHFDISQQAVSQHLHVLASAGLVRVRREGKRRLYVVDPEGLEDLDAFLADLWPVGLRRLKDAVEAGRDR